VSTIQYMATSPQTTPHGRLGRLADFTYRRRRRVVVAWVVGLIAVIALTPAIAGDFEADFGTSGSESERASTLVEQHFPGRTGDTVNVVWKSEKGVDDPAVKRSMDDFVTRAERLDGIGDASPPRVSRNGQIAALSLQLDKRAWDVPTDTGKQLIDYAEGTSRDGLTVAVAGGPVQDAEGGSQPEGYGLVAAAVVLLIAFGSLVAAGLPLVIALFGLGISASLIGVLAAFIDVPDFAPAVAGLIGIGVGIDYALLVLTRFRSELHAGADVRSSIIEAVGTAGRSVLVAGTTVLIAVNGLFLMGVSYLRGVALSASLSVLVVMIASVTLLPALLSIAGRRVDRLRIPGLRATLQTDPDKATLAERWSLAVQRRPVVALVAGGAIVLALTAPVLGLRLGFPDDGNARKDSILRTAYDLTAEGFGPGANGPLLIAAELPQGRDSSAALARVASDVRRDPNVAFVSPPQPSPDGRAAVITVAPRTTPQSDQTQELVERLRDSVIPRATGGTGVVAHVGGLTAAFEDQSELVADRLPLFIAGVVGLSLLLLLSAFRSPVIAIKAGLMNLLSVGAAYGVIALFAEGGFFGGLIGIDTETPVAPFIPVMMFAILFGLSMDYEVFLLSRVREEFQKHGNTARAVTDGLAKTARVITAAGAIMVVVFLAFIMSDESFLKLLGIGMATAIFVDATIIRMVLVPSIMQLMGRANWWMPRWLDRVVPRLDPHPPEAAPSAG
jgi:putative drug exporter of the RND superfamily